MEHVLEELAVLKMRRNCSVCGCPIRSWHFCTRLRNCASEDAGNGRVRELGSTCTIVSSWAGKASCIICPGVCSTRQPALDSKH
eukprot:896617-Amphidinium_carterae.3